MDAARSAKGPGPTRYRQLEVRAVERVTPRLVRVVLGGDELSDFVSSGTDQRIKLCLPRPGQPTPLGRSRAEVFALPREQQPKQRTYTVRWFDAERLELAVDLIVHDHDGPGAVWAANVSAGAEIVTVGPSPSYRPDPAADPLVLVGDETALPAMSAIVEELSQEAIAKVLVEVADAAEHQQVHSTADVEWTWLYRDGTEPGYARLLPEALRKAELGPNPHVWVGAEAETVHEIREYCEHELGLGRAALNALAYWRR